MKKRIAFIMALVMSASLFTACSDEDDSSSSASSTKQSTTEAAEEDTTEETEAETEEKTTEDNEIVKPTAGEDLTEPETDEHNAAKGTDFKRGSIDDSGLYVSDFSDVKFQTPDGWTNLTEEQLLAMMNLGLEITGNEENLDKELMEQAAIYEYSARKDTGANIVIAYENLNVSSPGYADQISEEVYLASMQVQFNSVSGVTYDNISSADKVKMGDNIYSRLTLDAHYDIGGGYTVKQNYYVRRIGDFMMLVIFTSDPDGEALTEYEQNFLAD